MRVDRVDMETEPEKRSLGDGLEFSCLRCTEATQVFIGMNSESVVGREGEIESYCDECGDDTFWALMDDSDDDDDE